MGEGGSERVRHASVHARGMVGKGLSEGWDSGGGGSGPPTLTVIGVNNLEVLDGGLCDSALEVEGVGAAVFIPDGGLVVQLDEALQCLVLPAHQQPIAGLGCQGEN